MVKVCKIMLSVSSLEAVWTLAVPLLLYDTASVPHVLSSLLASQQRSGLGLKSISHCLILAKLQIDLCMY